MKPEPNRPTESAPDRPRGRDLGDQPSGDGGGDLPAADVRRRGFEPTVSYRSNDYDVIRGFVRSGLGIALVPVMGHVEDPGVVTARVSGAPVHRHVEILTRTEVGNPAVSGVVAALRISAAAVHDREHLLVHQPAGSD